VFDATTTTVYVNGASAFTEARTGSVPPVLALALGQELDCCFNHPSTPGGCITSSQASTVQIDEFRWWSTARTATQIANNYQR
jgi:hypothetical protein